MRTRGFTLIELLVVLAIVAVLTTLAAPAFQRQIQTARISSAVNIFLADMRFARSEAMRRSTPVTLCRSNAPEAQPPTCAVGPQGSGWVSGWIVYHAGNGDGVIDADEIIRVQSRIDTIDAIKEAGPASTKIELTATGRLKHGLLVTSLVFGDSAFSPDAKRRVCISVGGRARIGPTAGC